MVHFNKILIHKINKNNCMVNLISLRVDFCYKKTELLFIFLLFTMSCFAQTKAPYVVNIAGNQVTSGNYNFEWSVGESAAITTMENTNLLVTNGLLQYNVENKGETNLASTFLPSDIRVYPNPVKNILDINILHAAKGIHQMELLDAKGTKLKEIQIKYYGMGAIESWDLGVLNSGQYFLNIRQTDEVTGKLIKKGAFKIVKIN